MEENKSFKKEFEENDLTAVNQQLNIQLKEKQEKIQELETLIDTISTKFADSIFQFVNVLSAIVTFQEKYYETSHSRFVSKYSARLAKELDLGEEAILNCQLAGLLHDIGKVGFKDSIMIKFPQEFTEKERIYYNTHCELGRDILKRFFRICFNIRDNLSTSRVFRWVWFSTRIKRQTNTSRSKNYCDC